MDLEAVGRWPSRPPWAVRSRFLLVLRFCFGLGRGVYAAHFGGLRLLRLFFRITVRGEPGRPEFESRGVHTPVENAIYLLGTSATRPFRVVPHLLRYTLLDVDTTLPSSHFTPSKDYNGRPVDDYDD